MISQRTKTDREQSIAADEFVWDEEGCTNAHAYVLPPIIKRLKEEKIKKILDIGCGNGAVTQMLAAQGFDIVGMDYSKTGIALAKKTYPEMVFEAHNIDESLPDNHRNVYEAVISIEVIEHLLLPRKLMSNAFEALKPGGVFILTTPYHGYLKNLALAITGKFDSHWHPLRDFGHIKFFSGTTIRQLFKECNFADVEIENVGRLPAFACSMVVSGRVK